jgi:hypothetical protein
LPQSAYGARASSRPLRVASLRSGDAPQAAPASQP